MFGDSRQTGTSVRPTFGKASTAVPRRSRDAEVGNPTQLGRRRADVVTTVDQLVDRVDDGAVEIEQEPDASWQNHLVTYRTAVEF